MRVKRGNAYEEKEIQEEISRAFPIKKYKKGTQKKLYGATDYQMVWGFILLYNRMFWDILFFI